MRDINLLRRSARKGLVLFLFLFKLFKKGLFFCLFGSSSFALTLCRRTLNCFFPLRKFLALFFFLLALVNRFSLLVSGESLSEFLDIKYFFVLMPQLLFHFEVLLEVFMPFLLSPY
jgi:ABC-type transport system involved in cytochrome c biogenesis permease subunit